MMNMSISFQFLIFFVDQYSCVAFVEFCIASKKNVVRDTSGGVGGKR